MTPREEKACPNSERHTEGPAGYLQWHAWAGRMIQDHRQLKCPGCGLYKIWVHR